MATMTMAMPYEMQQIDVVEKKVARVGAGLTFSQAMSIVFQAAFSAINITSAFHTAVLSQRQLIEKLVQADFNHLSQAQYISLAEKIEGLVAANEEVVEAADPVNFKPWSGYLEQIKDQSEHLESIAESLRMACDDESLAILAGAAAQMQSATIVGTESLCGAVHA